MVYPKETTENLAQYLDQFLKKSTDKHEVRPTGEASQTRRTYSGHTFTLVLAVLPLIRTRQHGDLYRTGILTVSLLAALIKNVFQLIGHERSLESGSLPLIRRKITTLLAKFATMARPRSSYKEPRIRPSLTVSRFIAGSRKSILRSTVIRVIESMQEIATASMVIFYFDFRDDEKRNCRGLLASLLVQFCARSDDCCDVLSRLYSVRGDGLRQPNDRALLDFLKEMLTVGKLGPTDIIVDALDKCPTITGTPSAREKVLDVVTDFVNLKHPNLHLCVTNRPEADIRTDILPLASHSVSLHDETGQMVDINDYISFSVNSDKVMNQWGKEDRNLVINKLRQEADGIFQWVFCQLDKLRRCLPGRIRSALDELRQTLDAIYERTLQDIDEENLGYAHRLFQCITVELAEFFLAIDFGAGGTPTLVVDWRPDYPESAVLSTCLSLIAVVAVDGSQVVQFSHFPVQEFLMSSRLATGCVARYYLSLEPAHTIVAQACLPALLQLDNYINKRSIEKYPLARYAAQHWVDHAKFQDVSSRAEDSIK